MISCIICSRQQDISVELKENIKSTIGCEYELIVIDNSLKLYTIFSAYNEGIRRSKGDVLCFMHEDVKFHTYNWGEKVITTFMDKTIGLVGVIGSQFLPNKMVSWWLCQTTVGCILQGNISENGKYSVSKSGVEINEISDVVAIDGLWFCMSKDMINLCSFDEKYYTSFHCYDMDICMQVLTRERRVVVMPDVLIEHKSIGCVLGEYYVQLRWFYNKWLNKLPIWRGIGIDAVAAYHMSNILEKFQETVCRNIYIENTKAYKLGMTLLKPFKFLKR